jgi:hypothetical protein
MNRRRRSALAQAERDLYLASRTAGDLHAAEKGPAALAERVTRRQVRRRLYQARVPIVPLPRGRRRSAAARSAPQMSAVGALAVFFGLVILVGGTIACAVSGQWTGMIFVVIFGFGPMLWAGRGGRDGLPPP